MPLSPEEYDAWYYTEKGKYISGLEKEVLLKMVNPQVGGILDIGCGTGYFTEFLSAFYKNIIGIDASIDMIKYATKKSGVRSRESGVRNQGKSNIKYLVADAENLPFKNGSFDVAVSITAVNFFKNPEKSISEAVRISKKKIFLGVLNKWSILSVLKKLKGFFGETSYSDACFYSQRDIVNILESPQPPFLKGGRGGIKKVQIQHTYFLPFPRNRFTMSGLERIIPSWLPFGGFIGIAGAIERRI